MELDMMSFCISDVEPSDFITRELVILASES
jgi:hypothetical protein